MNTKSDLEIELELKDIFDEALNDSYPVVVIGGITFYPADILANCDPIAYRCALADFESDYRENIQI